MASRVEYTPRGKIKAALRQLWLRSRERAAALKRDKYSCQKCGIKQSRKKGKEVYVEVHHVHGVLNWEELLESVYKSLLCSPDHLLTLCEECHAQETQNSSIINEKEQGNTMTPPQNGTL